MTKTQQTTSYYIKEKSQNYNKKSIFCFSLGLILLILGLLLLLTYAYIFDYFVTQGAIFVPGKYAFEMWKKPDTVVYFDYYFFNWTNPEDITNPNKKPKFEEVGPYRYRLYIDRANLTYNYENSTVSYRNQRTFYYDKNSPKNHSDVINSINVVALSAAYYGKDSFLLRPLVGTALFGSSIYVKKTVRELLFDGYPDSILSMSKFFSISSPYGGVPDKFAWFHIANGTAGIDGTFNMDVTDENFGKLRYLNYENKSSYFEDACSEIQISIGELYPRNLKPTTLSSYHSEMCRPMKLHFDKKVEVHGVSGYQFVTFPDIFDNGTLVKENKCFCKGDCLPYGVAQTCTLDYPLYYSLPHFYNADPSYLEVLEGLKPNKDLHDYTFTMEPITGATIDGSAKLQFNLLLEPMPFGMFEDVPKMMFPILWFKQTMVLSDDIYSNLSLIAKLPNVVQILAICLIIIGTILVVATLLYVIYSKNKINQKTKLPCKEEVPLQRKC